MNKNVRWMAFLAEALDVFAAKDADYDHRFTRALMQYGEERGHEAARTIWAWEVEKKLDRCRTWIKRGELSVRGEGVRDSVIDLFNYTVQYLLFTDIRREYGDKIGNLNPKTFFEFAREFAPDVYVSYWRTQGLLHKGEDDLRALLLEEMTGAPF